MQARYGEQLSPLSDDSISHPCCLVYIPHTLISTYVVVSIPLIVLWRLLVYGQGVMIGHLARGLVRPLERGYEEVQPVNMGVLLPLWIWQAMK